LLVEYRELRMGPTSFGTLPLDCFTDWHDKMLAKGNGQGKDKAQTPPILLYVK